MRRRKLLLGGLLSAVLSVGSLLSAAGWSSPAIQDASTDGTRSVSRTPCLLWR
ncbi:MAG: hypothetical protein IKJ37_07820 [Kiritimatiellae bacterium]|nr:hypothetical protein [Kiritimatiellia bacterium]